MTLLQLICALKVSLLPSLPCRDISPTQRIRASLSIPQQIECFIIKHGESKEYCNCPSVSKTEGSRAAMLDKYPTGFQCSSRNCRAGVTTGKLRELVGGKCVRFHLR